jgi:uncharacterized protein
MSSVLHRLAQPWPWYVAGPLIGLLVPLLLVLGNRAFGVSGGLRSMCAALVPGRSEFFRFDWKRAGAWNIAFGCGIALGGLLTALVVGAPEPAISEATRRTLSDLGIERIRGLVPTELFSWSALLTWQGLVSMIGGGFLIGFGSAYAGGCTSGHGITGLASLQAPSMVALVGFFAGGLVSTYLLVPLLIP